MTNPTTRPPGAVGDERIANMPCEALKEHGAECPDFWAVGASKEACPPCIARAALADPPEQQERQEWVCSDCNLRLPQPPKPAPGLPLPRRVDCPNGHGRMRLDPPYVPFRLAQPDAEQERPDPERVVVSRADLETVLLKPLHASDNARIRLQTAISQTPDGSAQTGGEERLSKVAQEMADAITCGGGKPVAIGAVEGWLAIMDAALAIQTGTEGSEGRG